ncbi:glycosyltransferase family 4 protein [Vibrio breoganii]
MNVLVVTNMYPHKGSNKGIFVQEQVESFRELSGLDVGFEVFNVDELSRFFLFKYIVSSFLLFNKILRNRYDVIHVHYGLTLIPLLPVLMFFNGNVILTCHGSDLMGKKVVNVITNFCAVFVKKIILVSLPQKIFLWAVNRPKAVVIPCGVSRDFFRVKDDIHTPEVLEKVNLIFPSSPNRPEKNFAAFRMIEQELLHSGICCHTIIFESLSRTEIRNSYYDAHFLVLTSHREGSPQVVKEAVFCGLPVISFDVGDCRTVLNELDNCLVSNDVSEIVKFIKEKMQSYSRLDEKELRSVVDCYSSSNVARRIYSLY